MKHKKERKEKKEKEKKNRTEKNSACNAQQQNTRTAVKTKSVS